MSRIRTQKLAHRKRRIERRLADRHWTPQDRPMFAAANIHYELADKARGLAAGGIGLMHRLARQVGLIEEIDRRLHDRFPFEAAEFLMREPESGYGARHPDRERPVMVRVGPHLAARIDVHPLGGRQWRLFAKVEAGHGAVGSVVEEKTATADVAGRRMRDRERKG